MKCMVEGTVELALPYNYCSLLVASGPPATGKTSSVNAFSWYEWQFQKQYVCNRN